MWHFPGSLEKIVEKIVIDTPPFNLINSTFTSPTFFEACMSSGREGA